MEAQSKEQKILQVRKLVEWSDAAWQVSVITDYIVVFRLDAKRVCMDDF